jgi:hypothetical protein
MNESVVPAPRPWRRPAAPQRARRAVLFAVGVLVLLLGPALTAGRAAADDGSGSGSGSGTVKVFVVPAGARTGTGQPVTLRFIASDTLGNPARATEVFQLNRGLDQPDGAALNVQGQPLHPGWILRLPQDATGPDVKLAKETGQGETSPPGGASTSAPTPPAGGSSTPPSGGSSTASSTTSWKHVLVIPLPAVLAVIGAIVLGLVTAVIAGRRRLWKAWQRAAVTVSGRATRAMGSRRRLADRRAVSRMFGADTESVRRAYAALGEVPVPPGSPLGDQRPVHALEVDDAGVTAWLPVSHPMRAPWMSLDPTRWRRDKGTAAAYGDESATAGACLTRVGTDSAGGSVFVELSRLDGVLSVSGDHAVARDVVWNLLAEIGRNRPGTPAMVLRGADGGALPPLPPGLRETPRPDAPTLVPRSAARHAVVGAAFRQPVRGIVVMAGAPATPGEAAEVAALCGSGGAGWTGLVCGEIDGAHWRWRTDADGYLDIPVLGVRVTAPAPA